MDKKSPCRRDAAAIAAKTHRVLAKAGSEERTTHCCRQADGVERKLISENI